MKGVKYMKICRPPRTFFPQSTEKFLSFSKTRPASVLRIHTAIGSYRIFFKVPIKNRFKIFVNQYFNDCLI